MCGRDWSSDVCSSDLQVGEFQKDATAHLAFQMSVQTPWLPSFVYEHVYVTGKADPCYIRLIMSIISLMDIFYPHLSEAKHTMRGLKLR